jgi:hypothetical protein
MISALLSAAMSSKLLSVTFIAGLLQQRPEQTAFISFFAPTQAFLCMRHGCLLCRSWAG